MSYMHINITLVIIPGPQSTHLNKQKDPLSVGESTSLDEACECDPCLELAMTNPGMSPHVLKSVETHPLPNTI
jgi:hypothetical protein